PAAAHRAHRGGGGRAGNGTGRRRARRQAAAARRWRGGQPALPHRAGRRAGPQLQRDHHRSGNRRSDKRSPPSPLSAAIADRLGFVPGSVREVLRAAALLGVDFAVPDLATVLGRSVADLIPTVGEALAAGVLAESGDGLAFRHPMIRAALYDEMPVPVRAAWHRDAGRALAETGAPADRVARQLVQAVGGPDGATDPMDEWILSWLARTAE